MNKRSRKTRGFPLRLAALLLCCVCLVSVVSVSAIALEADASPVTEETTVPTESTPETTAPEETIQPTDPDAEIMPVSETEETTAPTETEETTVPTEDATETEPVRQAVVQLSVYERLLTATSCEEAVITLQAEENAEAIYALTEAQLISIRTHVNELEDDGYKDVVLESLDMLLAIARGDGEGKEADILADSTFNITNTFTNAEVAYVKYTGGDYSNLTFTTVTSGQQVSESGSSGVLVFFVKPADGYLLTQFYTTSSAADLYAVTVPASQSNVYWFKYTNPTAGQAILDQAKALGYVGYFAFSYAGQSYTGTYRVDGQKPQMTVTAKADPNTDLKPGDRVTFTITIVPEDLPSVDDEVTRKEITSLKINGNDYTATQNSDGTYSVEYEITEEDWNNKKAHLDVTAELDYKYACGVTDRNSVSSSILTTTTITSSASCDVEFAIKKGVRYQLKFEPADITPPDTIPAAPGDDATYFGGENVTVKDYNRTEVDDPANQGTWTFTGWECGTNSNLQAGNTVNMTGDSLLFTGTWTFQKYPSYELTVRKTVSGNMQDVNKEFAFTVTADRDMTYNGVTDRIFTFDLKKDQETTITVPANAVVTVTENRGGYVQTINGSTTVDYEKITDGIKFTMPRANSTVIFNNDKNVTVDTGVLLDSLPYVLILALVAVGAVLFVRKRHNRDDD